MENGSGITEFESLPRSTSLTDFSAQGENKAFNVIPVDVRGNRVLKNS